MHDDPLTLEGSWYVGGSTERRTATLVLAGERLEIVGDDAGTSCSVEQARFVVVNGTLTVELPDGGAFVVASGQRGMARLLTVVEGRGRNVTRRGRRLGTLLTVAAGAVGLAALLVLVVLPALSRPVADRVPPSWTRLIDEQAIAQFDGGMLSASALPADTQQWVSAGFDDLVTALALDPARYRLLIRSGDAVGANAFALPGGTLVVTDRLIELVSPEELTAVLAHEIGHVELRHGLQQVLRRSGLAAVSVLVGSDAGAIAQLAARLPALLLQSGYSRAFEREADIYACRALTRLGVGPEPLAGALERLAAEPSGGASLPSWVSSHPDTEERVAAVRACGP